MEYINRYFFCVALILNLFILYHVLIQNYGVHAIDNLTPVIINPGSAPDSL